MNQIFDDDIDDGASGKNPEALAKSRKIRREFIEEYGCIPESILIYNPADKVHDMTIKDGRSYGNSSFGNKNKITDKKKSETYFLSGYGCRGKGGGLSRFPVNVGRIILKFYAPKNGIVFDPFVGHNSRMQLCFENGYSYIGIDLSKEFMKHNFIIRDFLLQKEKQGFIKDNKKFIDIHEHTSTSIPFIKSDSADFTITSPPYWDLEYYGDEDEQLGKRSYSEFLDMLLLVIRENFRVLKEGSFCCWFVNDFRKEGKFFSYHSDVIKLFNRAGFTHFNTYIVDLHSSIASAFVQSIIKTKILPKRHEYCLVFKKEKNENQS